MNSNVMTPRLYHLEKVKQETGDTFTWELTSLSEKNGSFHPGQFNMVYLYGIGEVPLSITGNPEDHTTTVHTIRGVGTVTKAMKSLKRGSVLGVRGPFGTSWPVVEAEGNDVVLIAGGIGLAPLRPALYHILANRKKYGKVFLLYGTRRPEDILYRKEIEQWRGRFDLEVLVTVDRADSSWHGNVGFVTSLIQRAHFDPSNSTAMICGPEIMMRFSALELMIRGVLPNSMFISMERNMKCGIGLCGHCQLGPVFICKEGPVFRYTQVLLWVAMPEV